MRSILPIFGLATFALAACGEAEREDAGPAAIRNFEVGEFQRIVLNGSHEVVVSVGGAPSVRAEGPRRKLERMEVEVRDGTLRIGTRRGSLFSFDSGAIRVRVTVPSLAGADIRGSGDIRVDRVAGERFEGRVAGSGALEIGELETRHASFDLAGSGDISATGQAEAVALRLAGSGDASLGGLAVRRAQVNIAGSGDASVNASERVVGRIAGSGELQVSGGARCAVDVAGSGDVRCGN